MKYAIIVGIDRYDRTSFGKIDLDQCAYDATRATEHLLPDIPRVYLTNGAATKARVLAEIEQHAAKLQAGDTLYYFQSSHGTYADLVGGHRATGRVMHDAVLWDYEIIEYLREFKEGVTVVTLSDMCFAESNSRTARLWQTKAVSVEPPPKPSRASLRGLKCSLLMVSACGIEETAKEIGYGSTFERGGVFTTALVKNKDFPLGKLRLAIGKETARFGQTPKIEKIRFTNRGNLPIFAI